MKLLLFFAAVIGVSFSVNLDDEWGNWKSFYAKAYDDEAQESVRRLVWEDNWRFVQRHNSEGHTYEVEMNEFADLVSISRVMVSLIVGKNCNHVTTKLCLYALPLYRQQRNLPKSTSPKSTWLTQLKAVQNSHLQVKRLSQRQLTGGQRTLLHQ